MTIEEEISIAEKAESGDVDAQLLYGKMLCGFADRVVEGLNGGIEVVRYWDLSNDGIRWLAKAAESGNKEAGELLQRIKTREIHVVTESEYRKKKATRHLSGDGKECEDPRSVAGKSVSLTIKAAESGSVCAQLRLAAMYVDGMVVGGMNKVFKLTGEIMRAKVQLFQDLVMNQGKSIMEAIEQCTVSTPEMEARYWLLKAEMSGSEIAHLCLEAISAGKTAKEAIDMYRDRTPDFAGCIDAVAAAAFREDPKSGNTL